jgi:glycosyltransferase involved in cell wall biosynthesis
MLDIITVTYGHNEILKCFINSIKSQTDSRWRLFIIHDGLNSELEKELINEGYLIEGKISFIQFPNRTGNYGHELRKWGLKNLADSDYVLLTNGDNYYTPNFVSQVLNLEDDFDFVYFNFVHAHKNGNSNNGSTYGFINSKLQRGFIDMGSVIIKTKIAKEIGFNSTEFHADWIFFDSILKKQKIKIKKIDKILFVHN